MGLDYTKSVIVTEYNKPVVLNFFPSSVPSGYIHGPVPPCLNLSSPSLQILDEWCKNAMSCHFNIYKLIYHFINQVLIFL